MAFLGAHGADGSVGKASIAVPAGGISAIGRAARVVLSLGAWLGINAPVQPGVAQREVILEGLRLMLSLSGTSIGTRFYRGRRLPADDVELPLGLVYQSDEQSEIAAMNYRKDRVLNVIVELHQKSQPANLNAPDIETALNALAREAETVIEADPSIGARCLWAEHTDTHIQQLTGDEDRGAIRLLFDVHYRTVRTDPTMQA